MTFRETVLFIWVLIGVFLLGYYTAPAPASDEPTHVRMEDSWRWSVGEREEDGAIRLKCPGMTWIYIPPGYSDPGPDDPDGRDLENDQRIQYSCDGWPSEIVP